LELGEKVMEVLVVLFGRTAKDKVVVQIVEAEVQVF
jgi:hypothetical protein